MIIQGAPTRGDSLLDQLPPETNPLDRLRAVGIDARFSWTQFFGGLLAGDRTADTSWQYGGRGDLFVTLDGERLGLWDGFSINLHGELVYGESVNSADRNMTLSPNLAMALPANGEFGSDLSLSFSQRFGQGAVLTVGKVNTLDVIARTPMVGAGGIDTFQHTAFAARPTGLLPPYAFGGMLSFRVDRVDMIVAVFDPVNAQNRTGLEEPFSEGVAGLVTATVPVKLGGLPGYYGVTLRANNRKNLDFSEVFALLPPTIPGAKDGAHYVGLAFQQYLHLSDPTHGWGLFGTIGFSDANPTAIAGGGTVGLAGNSPIPGRETDRFGIGYFYTFYSDLIVDTLAPFVDVGPEQGIEAFYNFHLMPGVYLSTNVQVIAPAIGDSIDVLGGIRLQTVF